MLNKRFLLIVVLGVLGGQGQGLCLQNDGDSSSVSLMPPPSMEGGPGATDNKSVSSSASQPIPVVDKAVSTPENKSTSVADQSIPAAPVLSSVAQQVAPAVLPSQVEPLLPAAKPFQQIKDKERDPDSEGSAQQIANYESRSAMEQSKAKYFKYLLERLEVEQKIKNAQNIANFLSSSQAAPANPSINTGVQNAKPSAVVDESVAPKKDVAPLKKKESDILLAGINGAADSPLIKLVVGNTIRFCRLGDDVNGWHLDSVGTDYVKMTKGKQSRTLQYTYAN